MDLPRVGLVRHIQAVSLGAKWPRAEDSRDCCEVQEGFRLGLLAKLLCSAVGHLEDTSPLAFVEDVLIYLLVIQVDPVRV